MNWWPIIAGWVTVGGAALAIYLIGPIWGGSWFEEDEDD